LYEIGVGVKEQLNYEGAISMIATYGGIPMEDNVEKTTELQDEGQEQKTYTQAEIADLLQKETDKRVSAALNKQKKDYEKKLSLSGLDEKERATAEKDMRIQELQDQLKQYQVLQNKNEVMKVLGARGLNPAFADLIAIGEDVEEAQARLDTLDKLFKEAVQTAVKQRLATGTPKAGAGSTDEMSTEQFKKMPVAQQNEIYKRNPELVKKLLGQ